MAKLTKDSGDGIIDFNWNSKYIDEHRRGISDIEWSEKQARGKKPKYIEGDVVEFMVGGFGLIKSAPDKDSIKNEGEWAHSYSTNRIKGMPDHKEGKSAWHYEGDFKRLVKPSALRNLTNVFT